MKIVMSAAEIMDQGVWKRFCEGRGIDLYAVNEGVMDSDHEFSLSPAEFEKLGLKLEVSK